MAVNKTIYGIAEALKINASTVSRALRDDPRVNEKTRQKVRDYANSIGYRPNVQARNLASGRTNTFWLLISDLFRQPEQQSARNLSALLESDDYDLMILTYHDDPVVFKRLLNRLDQNAADGAFVIGPRDDSVLPDDMTAVSNCKCPLVFMDNVPPATGVTGVMTDNFNAAKELGKRCVESGIDIVIVGFAGDSDVDRKRRRGLLELLRELEIEYIDADRVDELDYEELRKKKLAYITSSEQEVAAFVGKYFVRYPSSCCLTAGVFDQWNGDRDELDNIIVCRQNQAQIAETAYQKMLRILEKPELKSELGISKVKPDNYLYIKYTSIKERSRNAMTMRWTMAIIFGSLLLLSLLAWSLAPPPRTDGKTPLIWVTDANPQRDDQVNKFNEMYPKLDLTIDPDNSGTMKVVTQSSAGMGGDIIGHVAPNSSYQTYTEAGILWDVTEIAKKMGFGPETLPKQIRPLVMMKQLDKNGNIVERQYIYPCNVAHTIMIYNKNLFDKYKIPYPKEDLTWEDYLEICKKLTVYKDGEDNYPEAFGLTGADMTLMIWQNGGDILNKDRTQSKLSTEEAINAMQLYHDLYYKYRVTPTPSQKSGMAAQGGWGGNMAFFGSGKIATIWGARWMLIQFRRFIAEQKKARKKFLKENPGKESEAPEILRIGACLVPRFKGKKRITNFGCRGAGINAASKNRDEALKFLQYLASKQYSDILNQGADSKPGNKKYISLDQFINPKYDGEKQVHEMSLKAIPDGRYLVPSPFISGAKVTRILKKLNEKIVADEDITREEIAAAARRTDEEIDLEILRNIQRQKKLRQFYNKMREHGCEPIKYDKEVTQ